MKILRTRAASVSRQGLCTALLVASLTAAVGVSPPHNTADADDTAPGPDNPQGLPHGTPNLTLPDLKPRSPGGLPGKPGEGAGARTAPPASPPPPWPPTRRPRRPPRPNCRAVTSPGSSSPASARSSRTTAPWKADTSTPTGSPTRRSSAPA
ncbi:hypothetical protein ACFQ2B_19115 [Streptomyces stramineus]